MTDAMPRDAALANRPGRVLAGTIAVIALVSLGLQFWVFLAMTRAQGGHLGHAIWVFLSFFTVLTNALVAAACLVWAAARWPRWWPSAQSMLGVLAMSITLVALVYHAVLARLWNPVGLHFVADQGLHSAVPALFVLFWALHAPKAGLQGRDALRWLAYPAGYFVYALARGALDGWYPYPFFHAGQLGYARVLANGLVLTVLFALAGLVFIAAAKRLPQGQAP